MNLRFLCLLCALALDWSAPCPSRGQAQEPQVERPAAQADTEESDGARPKRSRGHSLGDLTVMGSDAVVKADQTAHDVVVMGGSAIIDGTVTGDLVVIMGKAKLGPTAVVRRDLVVVGGTLEADPLARIGHDRVVIGGNHEMLKHLPERG